MKKLWNSSAFPCWSAILFPAVGVIIALFLVSPLLQYCGSSGTEDQTDDVISVTENGQQVFYSEADKAYGDVYLGMSINMVDSLDKSPIISGRRYDTYKEYKSGVLTSYYLRSSEVSDSTYEDVIDEIDMVISSKYGELNMVWLSDLPELGIPKKTSVDGHDVHWGSHWQDENKFLGIGLESVAGSTSAIWLWIFNTNIWDTHKANKAQSDAENF